MSELVSYLNSNCKSNWSGRVWLDVEGTQYWLGSSSSNQAWYKVGRVSILLTMLLSTTTFSDIFAFFLFVPFVFFVFQYIQQLKDSCSTYGVKCGVYSSTYQWSSLFGSTSFSYGSELPLWYAHYDNSPSFSDFTAFGGWSTPHAKQYAGDVTQCRSVETVLVLVLQRIVACEV
jgi:hypothetical protein